MTDQQEQPETATIDLTEREIEFSGRNMWVRMPTPEALVVWQRTIKMLQAPDVTSWDGEQVLAALDRTVRIITSVLVNRVDITWLEDQLLDRELTLKDTEQIILKTIEAYGDKPLGANRAEKRAAKKATRKKAKA